MKFYNSRIQLVELRAVWLKKHKKKQITARTRVKQHHVSHTMEDEYEKCGHSNPPNLDCISRIPLPPTLNSTSLTFLFFSIFVILINGLLVIYVLSKTPRRRKPKKGNWDKYADKNSGLKMMVANSDTNPKNSDTNPKNSDTKPKNSDTKPKNN